MLFLPHLSIYSPKYRVVKTASKAKAVQVVQYQNSKRVVLQHIGSAHTAGALSDLMDLVEERIRDYTGQFSIFPDENTNRLLHLNHSTFMWVKYHYFHLQVSHTGYGQTG